MLGSNPALSTAGAAGNPLIVARASAVTAGPRAAFLLSPIHSFDFQESPSPQSSLVNPPHMAASFNFPRARPEREAEEAACHNRNWHGQCPPTTLALPQ